MKKSVKKNYLYNLSYQILIIILPIITAPYLARTLGPESIGINSYTVSIVTYFILFGSLGIALYGQREIAYNRNNKERMSKIFWELALLKSLSLIISCILFYFSFCLIGEYQFYYKILILEIIANCFDISWLYQGLEDFKKIVLRNFIVKIINICLIFIFIHSPEDITKYMLIYVFNTLFGNVLLWLNINKVVCKVKLKDLNIARHLKPTLFLFIPQVAIQIYTILDKTMLGFILNDMSEVGYYEQSQKIIKILLTLITSLGTVMLPHMANLFSQNKDTEIKINMKKSFNFVFFLAFPLIFGIISVVDCFVPLFFGEGYDRVKIIMSIISPIILFIGMSNIIGNQFLLTTKRQKEYTLSVISGAIANLILNLLLIKNYASYGASIATVFAEALVTAIQLFYIRKNFKLKDIFKLSLKYFFASFIMFLIIHVSTNQMNDGMIKLLTQVACGGFVYIAALLFMKDDFLIGVIKSIFKVKKLGVNKNEKI